MCAWICAQSLRRSMEEGRNHIIPIQPYVLDANCDAWGDHQWRRKAHFLARPFTALLKVNGENFQKLLSLVSLQMTLKADVQAVRAAKRHAPSESAGKTCKLLKRLVDLTGIEPVTSSMPWKRAPSCATGPQREEHPLFCWSMPNPSNAPYVATTPSPFSSVQGMFRLPGTAELALFTLLLAHGGGWAPRALAQAPATPPSAPSAFAVGSLRPALANVQTAISGLSIGHWKASSEIRTNAQQDVASMQRDLTATLPGLMSQAEASGTSGPALSPAFAVFRNLDALYDVLLRVTETAALTGPASDASSLEDARAGLEDGRAKLGAWLLQAIGTQDAQVAHAAAPVSHPAAAPTGPTKIVVDDGPETPKPRKKKPATPQAPQ